MSDETAPTVPASGVGRVRKVWSISFPLIVSSFAPSALMLADTAILGRYSTEALATIAFAAPIFAAIMAAIVPFGTAVQILVARWDGAGDRVSIARLTVFAPVALTVLGLVVGVACFAAAPLIVDLVSGGDAPPEAATVLRVLSLCFPLQALTHAFRGVLGGLGQTSVAMHTALVVNLANIPVSLYLVWGLDLGARGSAAGTLTATAAGTLLMCWFARRRLRPQWPRRLRLPRDLVAPLWRIGWPDVTFAVLAYSADIVYVALVAGIGTGSLAAMRTIVALYTLIWAVVFSVSSGISILAGQRMGARDLVGVDAYRRAGTIVMGSLAAILGIVPILMGEHYFRLFGADEAVWGEAVPALRMLVLILPMMVASMVLSGILRAAGDTKSIMYAGLAGQLLVSVPAAWLLVTVLDTGLIGVYIGLALMWATRFAVTWIRYRRRRWAELPEPVSAASG